jgi:hypothetical protein
MATALSAPPLQTPLIDSDQQGTLTGYITTVWNLFLLSITTRLQQGVLALKVTSRTGLSAAIVTAAALTTTSAGLYRVSYVIRVTQAATTSSSLTVTLGWVRSGVPITQAFAAIAGNTVTTYQSTALVVKADALTDLTYAVAYASVGATPMKFEIDVTVEQVS